MRTPQGEELSRLIWHILEAANRLTEAGNRLSAPFGLTAARWQVMGVIVEQTVTVADIARQLSQTRQGVQRLADELVRDGLAGYSPNPRHVRAKLLAPTPQGIESYRKLMADQAKWVNALSASMRVEDIAAARGLLATLSAALKAQALSFSDENGPSFAEPNPPAASR
ncbi:MarR family winged helix-turn-helix transcriptional regulator [Chelativorans sp. YIM 93263]|uniref:MarR family winged helix-turn-helix transcriptional regulator n=1 Tax=Chelativorans sp. YIM 93263 TaxID=2906648 RepID=UPI002379162E|nr:MarR family transcriptional regulator [Chelativorans sp. YIM 93263]